MVFANQHPPPTVRSDYRESQLKAPREDTMTTCLDLPDALEAAGVKQQFYERVLKAQDGHWYWTLSLNHQGYGRCFLANTGNSDFAHRIAYELEHGPIPDGLEIDHLCRIRSCVNPTHLEPVTHRENLMRGERQQVEACPKGHPYSGENLAYRKDGWRRCRTCNGWKGLT